MTSAVQLKRLRLKAFRGATREVPVNFEPSKRVTMVFGENGTGKSTLVDALTFLCEQTRGSLDDRAGAKEEKYLVSVGSQKKDLLVEIETASDKWTATLSGSKIIVTPNSGYPHLRVLRRPQISRFIEAEPKRRFEELKQFISTPGIDQSEHTLREAERDVSSEVERFTRDLTQARQQLEALWDKEGKKGTNADSWAKGIVHQDVTKLRRENDSIEKLDRSISALASAVNNLGAALGKKEKAQNEFQKAVDAQHDEEKKVAGQSSKLLQLLNSALDYLKMQPSLATCPVCDQTVQRKRLQTDLTKKISALGALSESVATTTSCKKALDDAVARVSESLQRVNDGLVDLERCLAQDLVSAELLPKSFPKNASAGRDVNLSMNERLNAAKNVLGSIEETMTQRKVRADENTRAINLQNAVSLQMNTLDGHQVYLAKAHALSQRLRAVLEIVENERKAFVNHVLSAISGDVAALHGLLHPNEPIGNINLLLDPRYQGSLLLRGDFVGMKDIPPQAYFSESHLDTLGICIFLAFAKRFSPPGTLVVLDDILTSIDGAHLDRFIDLLDSEAHNFGHVIITTHYRPWRERYRMHQAASSKFHFIELKEWSPDRGIISDTCMPAIQELKDCLDPRKFDRQVVASKSGILLESLLDHLSLLYRSWLPRKPAQDYTLGEYLASFSRKDRSLFKVEHLDTAGVTTETTALGPIIDALDGMVWIRNQVGCHFSITGQSISNSDVRAFGEKVVDLGVALTCCEGGDLPKHNRSGSCYESQRKRCRLYPLQLP